MTLLHIPEHELEIDVSGLTARLRGEPLRLSPLSARLLALLAENHGRVIAFPELRRTVWEGVHVGDAAIYQAVRSLRAELGRVAAMIRNERGVGYRLLASVVEAPAAPGFSTSPLVGRTGPLEVFRRALGAALQRIPQTLIVYGEAGIGKSRLLEEIALRSRRRGAKVALVSCRASMPSRPLDPWRDVLAQLGLDTKGTQLNAFDAALLDRAFSERSAAPDSTARHTVVPGERDHLFELLQRALDALGHRTPIVILLDDLRYADEISLRLFEWIATRARATSLLLVASVRLAARSLPRLLALPEVEAISLGRLEAADVEAVAAAVVGKDVAAADVDRLHRRSGGNPFLLHALLRLGLDADPAEGADFPHMLRAAIHRILAETSPTTVAILSDAALLGNSFSERALREISDEPAGTISTAIGEGIASGVLLPAADDLRFAHDLLAEALYEDIPRARRAERHARAVFALERRTDAGAEVAIRLAEHAWNALGELPDARVPEACVAAAQAAMGVFAFETAAMQLGRALELVDGGSRRAELLLARAEALSCSGDAKAAEDAVRQAIDLSRALRAPDLLARAVLTLGLVRGEEVETTPGTWITDLEEAIAASPTDPSLRARLLALLSHALWARDPHIRAGALAHEAVEVARRSTDSETLAYVLTRAYRIDVPDLVDLESRRRCVHELERLEGKISEPFLAQDARQTRLLHAYVEGDRTAVDRIVSSVSLDNGSSRTPHAEYVADSIRASYAHLIGRFDEAEALSRCAFERGRSLRLVQAERQLFLQLLPIKRDAGRLDELAGPLGDVAQRATKAVGWGIAWRLAEAHGGRKEAARELLRWMVDARLEPLGPAMNVAAQVAMLADIAVLVGAKDAAAPLYEAIAGLRHTHAATALGYCHWGSVARLLGTLAALQDDFATAEADFEEGLARDRKLGALPFVARGSVEYGAMLARRRAPGDAERAQRLLGEGRRLALELGIHLDGMTPYG